jgi:hypothetical protein
VATTYPRPTILANPLSILLRSFATFSVPERTVSKHNLHVIESHIAVTSE